MESLGNQPVNLSPQQERENNVMIRMIHSRRNIHPVYQVGRVLRIVEGEAYPIGALGRIKAYYSEERVILLTLLRTGKDITVPEWCCDVPKHGK